MKLLKSDCENAWLFDCQLDDGKIKAGMACFMPFSPSKLSFTIKGKSYSAIAPLKACDQPGAVRIVNARLPLLD